jgi:hypothetical protein
MVERRVKVRVMRRRRELSRFEREVIWDWTASERITPGLLHCEWNIGKVRFHNDRYLGGTSKTQ